MARAHNMSIELSDAAFYVKVIVHIYNYLCVCVCICIIDLQGGQP